MRVHALCTLLVCGLSSHVAFGAVALENAYWRFEEGVAGAPVDPPQADVVLDSSNNNHMRTFASGDPVDSRPRYTDDVPVTIIPQTGQPNTLALHFTPNQDIYTNGKTIDNPLVEAMTIEAAFKPETVTAFQAIVGKDGRPLEEDSPLQTWVLKIRGDNGNLQVEFFDKSGAVRSVQSLEPLAPGQWYYSAVVCDSATCSLYLDRNDGAGYVLQGTVEVTDGPLWQGPDGDNYGTPWAIGRGMYNGGVTDWFAGVIDEVQITNEALDVTEFLFFEPFPPGDFDKDYDVDGQDFLKFDLCRTGPEVLYTESLPEGCDLTPDVDGYIPPDFDKDYDVDHDDFGAFQANYTG